MTELCGLKGNWWTSEIHHRCRCRRYYNHCGAPESACTARQS